MPGATNINIALHIYTTGITYVTMQVKDKHDVAFEVYYKTRSFSETSRQTGNSRQAVHRWYKQLKWEERIVIRA